MRPRFWPPIFGGAGAIRGSGHRCLGRLEQANASSALAIVAIEKFNRNAMHRAVERTYAELHRSVSGRLPDLS